MSISKNNLWSVVLCFIWLSFGTGCHDYDYSEDDAGANTGGTSVEEETVCTYTNPHSDEPECREFVGDWSPEQKLEDCDQPFGDVGGKVAVGECDHDSAVGSCTLEYDNGRSSVTWYHTDDPIKKEVLVSSCENFLQGTWDGERPTGSGENQLMSEALDALVSDALVTVNPECTTTECVNELIAQKKGIVFTPTSGPVTSALIYYPGGGVDVRAYAPLARSISESGFIVILVPVPGNMALGVFDLATGIMEQYPDVENWFIGGHSLGGVAAAKFVFTYPGVIDGVVLHAAFPDPEFDLSTANEPIIVISGSLDGLSTPEEIEASKPSLPSHTEYVEIRGGNHAQFGWYGEQDGDNLPHIARVNQQEQIVGASANFMGNIVTPTTQHNAWNSMVEANLSWCSHAQLLVANVAGTAVTEAHIDEQYIEQYYAFANSVTVTESASSPPIKIKSFPYDGGNPTLLSAPGIHTNEMWCKLQTQDAIVEGLGATAIGAERTCEDVNRSVIELALASVSEEEAANFRAHAPSLEFRAMTDMADGMVWLYQLTTYEKQGTGYVFSAPYYYTANFTSVPITHRGCYYCKLWSPTRALRFVLEHR